MADASVASIIISAGVGAVVAFVGAVAKNYLDARREIDKDLRTRREPEYLELWKLTRRFQQWPHRDVSRAGATELQRELADWYYDNGGIYLSRKSHEAYQRVHRALDAVTSSQSSSRTSDTDDLDSTDRQAIGKECGRLRTALTGDLLTRRSSRRIV